MVQLLQVFKDVSDPSGLSIFEDGKRTDDKQDLHTVDSAKLLEHNLKKALTGLAQALFGKGGLTDWLSRSVCYHMVPQISGPVPRLNIKTVFPKYGDSHVKDKMVGETVLSLTWESLYC